MTRETALYKLCEREDNPLNIINEVFNDFESRTCENCKHLDKSLSICWMKVEIDGYMGKDKSFGCIPHFERKDK